MTVRATLGAIPSFATADGSSIRELAGPQPDSAEPLVLLCCCAPPYSDDDTVMTGR